jgi:hypothetical protein
MTMKDSRDQLYFSPPSFPERHNDSFAADRDELLAEIRDMRETVESIRKDPHYSASGKADRIAKRFQTLHKALDAFKQKTVGRIDAHVKEETAKALAPKPITEDPTQRFLRLQAKRAEFVKEDSKDSTKLWMRLKQAVDNGGGEELIAALTLLNPEFPVGPPELIEQTKIAIAERDHPQLGEMAQLRNAYTYLLGTAVQEMQTVAGVNGIAAHAASDAVPYLVGTGEPVPSAK